MKTTLNKALYKISFLLFLFIGFATYAGGPSPSVPSQSTTNAPCYDANGDPLPIEDCPPGPPIETAPVDKNLTFLLSAGIIFGLYTVYNNKLTKKRPI